MLKGIGEREDYYPDWTLLALTHKKRQGFDSVPRSQLRCLATCVFISFHCECFCGKNSSLFLCSYYPQKAAFPVGGPELKRQICSVIDSANVYKCAWTPAAKKQKAKKTTVLSTLGVVCNQ